MVTICGGAVRVDGAELRLVLPLDQGRHLLSDMEIRLRSLTGKAEHVPFWNGKG
jgi:hypothetical protein